MHIRPGNCIVVWLVWPLTQLRLFWSLRQCLHKHTQLFPSRALLNNDAKLTSVSERSPNELFLLFPENCENLEFEHITSYLSRTCPDKAQTDNVSS